MNITVALPRDINARVEGQPDLVPKSDPFRGVYSGLCEVLDDLHHVLNRWLI